MSDDAHIFVTDALAKRFQEVGDQDVEDPIVIAKFFTPWTGWTWYATAYYPEEDNFFGYVVGHFPELGYFSKSELESISGPAGLKIERDLYWQETPLSKIISGDVH